MTSTIMNFEPPQRYERSTLATSGRLVTRHDGPLFGLSFVVKDNIRVRGMPFTSGHPLFANRVAEKTAPAVELLLAAGAEFRGMTETDAGGFGVTTPQTKNPVFPEYVVGGSSGGTAAAVAADRADFGLGTDTGGSVRIPAACTGLFAFKPTFEAVPTEGMDPLAPSLDHIGLMARNFHVLSRAATTLLRPRTARTVPARCALRIGIDRKAPEFWSPETRVAFQAVCRRLRARGHILVELLLPEREDLAKAHGTLVLREARELYVSCSREQLERLGEAAARALRSRPTRENPDYDWALGLFAAARATMTEAFARVDLVINPTLAGFPPLAGKHEMELGNGPVPAIRGALLETCLGNVLGTPVIGIPTTERVGPLPFNLQLMGPRGSDRRLLELSPQLAETLCA